MKWPEDKILCDALSVGRDFAGVISFEDLSAALHPDFNRHQIVSVIFVGWGIINGSWQRKYEVVLQMKH